MTALWILCFSLHLIPGTFGGHPILGKPSEGRSFVMYCTYKPGHEANAKYVTKVSNSTSWEIFRTSEHDTLISNVRFSFYDDTSKKVVSMTLDEVTTQDSGKYVFGIDVLLWPDPHCKFQLDVQRGSLGDDKLPAVHVNSTDGGGQIEGNFTTLPNHASVKHITSLVRQVGESHNQFESWFSLPILVCVCALFIVCVFSLLLLFKMHCNTDRSQHNAAPITLSYRPESSQLSDYETMSSGVVIQTQSSAPVESEAPSDTDAPIPVYAEVQRRSHVYQNLRAETLQEAIYHSLDVSANKHESSTNQETFIISAN